MNQNINKQTPESAQYGLETSLTLHELHGRKSNFVAESGTPAVLLYNFATELKPL